MSLQAKQHGFSLASRRLPRTPMRLLMLLLVLALPVATMAQHTPEAAPLVLVAHRGVVNDTLLENSLSSLEETIRRGYTHIEVDLRSTKDGHAVCLHDQNLNRTVGIDANIDEITLAELRAVASAELVPTFETFCARSQGRIHLMPDIKETPPDLEEAFGASIEASMVKYGLMTEALVIGQSAVVDRFLGKARIRWREPLAVVEQAAREMENPGAHYFIFNHAADFNRAEVEGFHKLGLDVVVSINTFHYREGDPVAQGVRDIEKMLALGIDGLQIDAVYDSFLFDFLISH